MFEKGNELLIECVLENLFSKAQVFDFLDFLGIALSSREKGLDKNSLIRHLARLDGMILLVKVRNFARGCWKRSPKEFHIKNLRSGSLKGHGWHGARPSTLHLSLQTCVRNYINSSLGEVSLMDLIEIGAAIMKHEYFMVAVADICEGELIEKFETVIPSITSRGVFDFVFGGVPYDLKNSVIANGWTFDRARSDPRAYVGTLVGGADVDRLRKQAIEVQNNWGNNRFYVIVEREDIWLDNPEAALTYVCQEAGRIENEEPLEIKIAEDLFLYAKIIFVPDLSNA